MWILKFFDIKDLRYVVLGAVVLYGFKLHKDNQQLKKDNQRIAENFNQQLKIDSLEVAVFKVASVNELQNILNQNKSLKGLITQKEIKAKRIQVLYQQQLKYVDSVKKKTDVSGLVANIRKDVPAVIKWRDTTKCLTISGNIAYKNDSLSVNVKQREFNNETVLIKSKGRRKKVGWLFGLRLGPRENKFTPSAKCGDPKVKIIEKVE